MEISTQLSLFTALVAGISAYLRLVYEAVKRFDSRQRCVSPSVFLCVHAGCRIMHEPFFSWDHRIKHSLLITEMTLGLCPIRFYFYEFREGQWTTLYLQQQIFTKRAHVSSLFSSNNVAVWINLDHLHQHAAFQPHDSITNNMDHKATLSNFWRFAPSTGHWCKCGDSKITWHASPQTALPRFHWEICYG